MIVLDVCSLALISVSRHWTVLFLFYCQCSQIDYSPFKSSNNNIYHLNRLHLIGTPYNNNIRHLNWFKTIIFTPGSPVNGHVASV